MALLSVSEFNSKKKVLVRANGLEPSCPCGRQPLKLVRLPISPRAHHFENEV
jgi:hypothetical protein